MWVGFTKPTLKLILIVTECKSEFRITSNPAIMPYMI